MLGINEKSWTNEMMRDAEPVGYLPSREEPKTDVYSAYFGLGHSIRLIDRPDVFKISPAGLAVGATLVKVLDDETLTGRFLDVGTGSGALAFLLRSMGGSAVTGTDVSAPAVALAVEAELLNFPDARITFRVSDLFSAFTPDRDQFDTIIFNPPGWRTPSPGLRAALDSLSGDIEPSAMFYGDQVLLKFLTELPQYLRPGGKAIVGMNSLVGIKQVLDQYKQQYSGNAPLSFRLRERQTFPLMFYSGQWERLNSLLQVEFADWRNHYGAAYTVDSQNNISWSYEIVEFRLGQGVQV